MQQAHVFIEGRVQGVGFRHFAKVNAEEVGVYGWVKNLPDGRVEAIFAGPLDHIREMVNRCEEGPGASRVDDIDVTVEEAEEDYEGFEVRYY
jgi:acylphosphatase